MSEPARTLGYYPGCSLHATSKEYALSIGVVAEKLGLTLKEIEDWACCGSSSAHVTSHLLSVALPARTLAQAEEQGHDRVLAPCAACYSRLATARHEMSEDEALTKQVQGILQRPFTNGVAVLNIAQVLRELAPTIQTLATTPLKELKVACYYGCLLVRPAAVTQFDDAEAPTSMEEVIRATRRRSSPGSPVSPACR